MPSFWTGMEEFRIKKATQKEEINAYFYLDMSLYHLENSILVFTNVHLLLLWREHVPIMWTLKSFQGARSWGGRRNGRGARPNYWSGNPPAGAAVRSHSPPSLANPAVLRPWVVAGVGPERRSFSVHASCNARISAAHQVATCVRDK